MSIGFFLDDNEPVMWRGPMLHRALEQFLQDVHWGELDVLVVDMPPGTGDVSISLGQLLPRAEAVIVTTPQPLAQEVACRAAMMAQKTGMRVVGVIENMTSEVFGSGGGERLADELGVPLLGTRAARRPLARGGATPASRSSTSDPDVRARRRRSLELARARSTRAAPAASRAPCRSLVLLSVLAAPEEARAAAGARSASGRTTSRRSPPTSSTPRRRGRASHGVARIEWLETWPELDVPARPRSVSSQSRGTSAGTAAARSATSRCRRRRGAARDAADAPASSSARAPSRPGCSATGRAGSRTAASSRC